jgi:hypothetical protein
MRFGRKTADPDRLAKVPLARYIKPPPPVMPLPDWAPGLWGNDMLPDCTCVAYANAARAFAWSRIGADIVVVDGTPQALYASVIGKPGATNTELAATEGTYVLDVLTYSQNIGVDLGEQTKFSCDYHALSLTGFQQTQAELAWAMHRCGAAYLGIDLHQADFDTPTGGVWDAHADPGPLRGEHAVIARGYTGLAANDVVWLGTWAEWQPVTWAWVAAYTREAYALGWRQLMPPGPPQAYDDLWTAETSS